MKNRIKEIRKEKKITQQELVDDLDITLVIIVRAPCDPSSSGLSVVVVPPVEFA